ncbi:MAG: FAD-binding protein, partial [Sphingobacteriales bacterium]
MKKFNKVINLDRRNLQVVTEPGVITQELQDYVKAVGLMYPPDPASRGSCFIGGNVSENSGGPRAVKYGVVKDYVINLEVVLPTGEIIWTGANVLKNADLLLHNNYNQLDGINLYCLGMIILFHDVGNIEGRTGHNKKIAEVYNEVRNKKPEFSQERNCVIRAAEAHTGFSAKDSTTDTLKDVAEVDHIDGKKIHLRELATLLRLADECAEGHQRTSDYLNKTGVYDDGSQIY